MADYVNSTVSAAGVRPVTRDNTHLSDRRDNFLSRIKVLSDLSKKKQSFDIFEQSMNIASPFFHINSEGSLISPKGESLFAKAAPDIRIDYNGNIYLKDKVVAKLESVEDEPVIVTGESLLITGTLPPYYNKGQGYFSIGGNKSVSSYDFTA